MCIFENNGIQGYAVMKSRWRGMFTEACINRLCKLYTGAGKQHATWTITTGLVVLCYNGIRLKLMCTGNVTSQPSHERPKHGALHYNDVIMDTMASEITSLTIVYSTVYSGADQRKHQSSMSLAFVWGIHRGPVNSAHKWPVTRKMFPFDDVIMLSLITFHIFRLFNFPGTYT